VHRTAVAPRLSGYDDAALPFPPFSDEAAPTWRWLPYMAVITSATPKS
jgi:hypothetical protein